MSGKGMSLKARIRNLSKEKNVSAQALLQTWVFQRFLSRLEKSTHNDRFVLKGGVLIAAWVGVGLRATMDIDMTVRNLPLTDVAMQSAIRNICSVTVHDDVSFWVLRVEPIRDDDLYGGLRVFLSARYDTLEIPFSIDITTSDAITPKPCKSSIPCFLDDSHIAVVWVYPIETVLAEKVETILSRGIANTRARDFYDIFILTATQPYDMTLFKEALTATTKHRGSTVIIGEMAERITVIANSRELRTEWGKYCKLFHYAADITYEQTIASLKRLCEWGAPEIPKQGFKCFESILGWDK